MFAGLPTFLQAAPTDQTTGAVEGKPAAEATAPVGESVGESTAANAKKLVRSASATMNDATAAVGERVGAATVVLGERVGAAAAAVNESAVVVGAQKFVDENPAVKEALKIASEKASEAQVAVGAHLGTAQVAVGARLGTARGGQQLISDPSANAIVTAKKVSTEVVSSDAAVLAGAQTTLNNFRDAAQKLREAAQVPSVEGIDGQADFVRLAEGYETKAKVYEQIVQILQGGPVVSAPPATPVEQDAIVMLQAADRAAVVGAASYAGLSTAAAIAAENIAVLSAAGYTSAANYLSNASAAGSAANAPPAEGSGYLANAYAYSPFASTPAPEPAPAPEGVLDAVIRIASGKAEAPAAPEPEAEGLFGAVYRVASGKGQQ